MFDNILYYQNNILPVLQNKTELQRLRGVKKNKNQQRADRTTTEHVDVIHDVILGDRCIVDRVQDFEHLI
jgi:hypothetical protein